MDTTKHHHVKLNKPYLERQIFHVFFVRLNLDFIYRESFIHARHESKREAGEEED